MLRHLHFRITVKVFYVPFPGNLVQPDTMSVPLGSIRTTVIAPRNLPIYGPFSKNV